MIVVYYKLIGLLQEVKTLNKIRSKERIDRVAYWNKTGQIYEGVKSQIEDLKNDLVSSKANDELLTREETCNFLKIDPSTSWHWQKKGKVKAYGIANRRYCKRSELLECLIFLK